ncbi:hypothetical protein [Nocardioides sp. LHG3406-4]|uniref:hypothetical protein n=1 Tax=Nocardioides sp. LHG3406-4 TaxID=2804575 RepID=UPI003CEB1C6B
MVANPFQLRADVTALDVAAQTWAEMAVAMSTAADELVATAQKAFSSGWESMSSEGYDAHRKQVVGTLDSLALVAEKISDTLTKVSGSLTAAQRRLDREWSFVALVPHSVVGADGMVVFTPGSDEQNTQVEMAKSNAAGIRSDLDFALYGDVDTLRRAKTEFDYTARQWADVVARGPEGIDVLGWLAADHTAGSTSTTTVLGETQSGSVTAGAGGGGLTAASYAPVGSVSFSAPSLGGAALAGASALFAAGKSGRRSRAAQAAAGTGALGASPMAGAAAGRGGGGAMLAGKGGGSRPGMRGSQAGGSARAEDPAAAREAAAAKEAKQKAIADRRAARAARKAAREAERARAAKPVANIVDDE